MKKILSVVILSMTLLFSGCQPGVTNLEVVYKLDKTASYTTNQVYESLSLTPQKGYVYIVLKDDFNLDSYREMITEDMSHEEVDRIIMLSRESAKNHFKAFNEFFIDLYELHNLSGTVKYSTYGPFIHIYYGSLNLSQSEIDILIHLSKLDEVLYIEFTAVK